MYEQYFGLKEQPFSLTPDTDFVFRHAGHQEALNELLTGLHSGEGFIAVIAEVGSGKTLLCRKLLTLLPEDWSSAYLPNPLLTPVELFREIATELGIDLKACRTLQELQRAIFSRLVEVHKSGAQTIILIDEAQAMSQKSLEALRLLSNLETEKKKLLQIVFFAQPEFEKRLAQHAMRQLRQRITYICRMKPMQRLEIDGYLRHRMAVAGYNGPALFTSSALRRIYRCSEGSPRMVNIIANKALMVAFGQGEHKISGRQVAIAIADTMSDPGQNILGVPFSQFWLGLISSLGLTLLIVCLLKVVT